MFCVFPPHKIFLHPPSVCTKSKSTKKPKRSRRHHLFDNVLPREKRFLVVIVPPLVPSEEHDDEDE